MKTMKRALVTVILFCAHTRIEAAGRSPEMGTELGNGFVDYENALIGFKTRYPKKWNRFDLDSGVTFSENSLSPEFVRMSELSATSPETLQTELQIRHPDCQEWHDIVTSQGLAGIECLQPERGIRAFSKSDGLYLEVVYRRGRSGGPLSLETDIILDALSMPNPR